MKTELFAADERPPLHRTTSRLYDRNFVLALTCQTCFVIANTLLAHYARWIEFLGGNVSQVGRIMGAGAVLGLVLRPWMAQWINRLGARTTWFLGYAVFAVGSWGNLLLQHVSVEIYLLRACLVLGSAIVFASSLTYISQFAPIDRRTEAIGIIGVGGFLGMLVGPAVGDVILSSGNRSRGDFDTLFWVAGFVTLVPSLLLMFLRPPAARDRHAAVHLSDFVRTVRRHWPGAILLVDLSFGICMTVPFVFLASYVDDVPLRIPGTSVIGLYFWCYAGWGLLVRVTLRRIPELYGRRKVLLLGTVFMTVGMFCFLLVGSNHPMAIVIPALITGTGHALMFHTMMSLTIESFPHEVRGTGSVLGLMMLDLGAVAGAPVLGQIADSFGFAWMFVLIGLCSGAAATAYAWSSIPVWRNRRGSERDPSGQYAAAQQPAMSCDGSEAVRT